MKKYRISFSLTIIFILIIFLFQNAVAITRIFVYGSLNCEYTRDTLKTLKKAGIKFVFKNIDHDEETNQEMWKKVRRASWYQGGSIGIPIVVVENEIFQRPSFDVIKSAIEGSPYANAMVQRNNTRMHLDRQRTTGNQLGNAPANSQARIIVYGKPRCSYCKVLTNILDSAGINYVYKDIRADLEAKAELIHKLKAAPWYRAGVIGLPIVDVNGILMERPTFEQIQYTANLNGNTDTSSTGNQTSVEPSDTANSIEVPGNNANSNNNSMQQGNYNLTNPVISQPQKVVVYGATSCNFSKNLMLELNKAGVQFEFRNIDFDTEANSTMWRKIRNTAWYNGRTVGLPVVDVNGVIFQRPTVKKIRSILNNTN